MKVEYWTLVVTIVCSVLGGGAFLKFLEFLIRRKDKINELKKTIHEQFEVLSNKIDDLEKKVNEKFEKLHKELEYDAADNARIRILTFSEEIQRGQKHSKEAFDQINLDIDKYEKHCKKYKDYPNSKANMAIKIIKEVYVEDMKLEKDGYEGFLS